MSSARRVLFHAVRMGMIGLVLAGGAMSIRARPDAGAESADAPEKASEKGLSPNASITSVSGLEVDTYRMNLMYSIPMTPSYKVADGVSYGVTARYSSNLYNLLPVLGPRIMRVCGVVTLS